MPNCIIGSKLLVPFWHARPFFYAADAIRIPKGLVPNPSSHAIFINCRCMEHKSLIDFNAFWSSNPLPTNQFHARVTYVEMDDFLQYKERNLCFCAVCASVCSSEVLCGGKHARNNQQPTLHAVGCGANSNITTN